MADLTRLTDDELLRHAHADFDPLCGTALEAELLRRFEEYGVVNAENEPLLAVLEDKGFSDADDLKRSLDKAAAVDERVNGLELLDVLLDFDIDDPATLKKALERNAKFESVLDDLAEPLASLQALVTTE